MNNNNIFHFTSQQITAINSLINELKLINCNIIEFINNGAIIVFEKDIESFKITPVIITFNYSYNKIYNLVGIEEELSPITCYFKHRYDFNDINYREEIKKIILEIISSDKNAKY